MRQPSCSQPLDACTIYSQDKLTPTCSDARPTVQILLQPTDQIHEVSGGTYPRQKHRFHDFFGQPHWAQRIGDLMLGTFPTQAQSATKAISHPGPLRVNLTLAATRLPIGQGGRQQGASRGLRRPLVPRSLKFLPKISEQVVQRP